LEPVLPFPPQLQQAIQRLAEGSARRGLAARSAEISAGYRERRGSAASVTSETDVVAYALSRMPATYAANEDALIRLSARAPGFSPATILDLGCGPGTASWAAAEAFPSIEVATLVDSNAHFRAAAEELAQSHEVLAKAAIVRGDLNQPPSGNFDLVVLSYALTEIVDPAAAIERIWERCTGALLIVEPGTPRDYERLMRLRSRLLELGASIAAPCPHHAPCPLIAPDWCHFSVRLARTRDHMHLKGGTLGYEDEKFSYLAVTRPGVELLLPSPRVLAKPVETKFEVTLKLCETDGAMRHRSVLKRDAGSFRAVRKRQWGDAL
jgi:ribosomal protein RSM22 (predicted rRNA methylase)